MSRMHLINRAIWVGVPAVAVVLSATGARSETTAANTAEAERTCMTAFKSAQEREKAGHLVEASQLFVACEDETCGSALWEECAANASRLRASVPSVVPLVVDDRGQPRADVLDVRVKMDGVLLISRLDGRALLVDPGTHEFSFDMGAGVVAIQKVTIVRGQRNRAISVSLRVPNKHEKVSTLATAKK
jgi:hypothetical protein